MPRHFTEIIDGSPIGEDCYAKGDELTTTGVNSCLVLMAMKDKGELIGIHLVMLDEGGNLFTPYDMVEAINILGGENISELALLGDIGAWTAVEHVYRTLLDITKSKSGESKITIWEDGKGVFKAIIKNDSLVCFIKTPGKHIFKNIEPL